MKKAWRWLTAVCVLVIGVYVYMARSAGWESLSRNATDTYYNLLVDGFRAGHLSLKKDAPLRLTQLADPYDPTANAVYRASPYRLYDLSYYKGRLYLYFGVTPALILFWPFVALTGHYLSHREAVVIFCAIGFLASVGLLQALWRRYFADVSAWVVAVCALALGLATGVPVILPRSAYNEVAISCGYMLTMLALVAIWCALHEPKRRCRWLAAASVAYGLAVGARPSLLFGAVILLVPVVQAWPQRRQTWAALVAATGPIVLIGLGLMLYNELRFDGPFEFGVRYQLTAERQVTRQFFSLHLLWFNFRVYFLEPARWSAQFPFVREIAVPPSTADYARVETPFGILTNVPLVWLALAVPLAWRDRTAEARSTLCGFLSAAALLFGICALVICLFRGAIIRYEVDFLPALLLLAVVGVLGLERTLADRPVRRRAARWGWGVLLGFSVAFNLLASVQCYAIGRWMLGVSLAEEGRAPEAIQIFEEVLRLKPDYAEAHNHLGRALERSGHAPEAIPHYEQAVRLKPDYLEAHINLSLALLRLRRTQESVAECEAVLRLVPDSAEAHVNLGNALLQMGRAQEAIRHYEQALSLNPDRAEAHSNLGAILQGMGRLPEAIGQYEQALRITPDYVEAHFNLGLALEKSGCPTEAVDHYQQALKLRPDFAPARNALARLRAAQ